VYLCRIGTLPGQPDVHPRRGEAKNGEVGRVTILSAAEIKPPRKVCKFGQKPKRHAPRPPAVPGLPGYTRPLSSGQTSLRAWPGPPDRKLINECKRGNVVDKFNKIVHAQLVSLGVNTFWRPVPLPVCRIPQLLTLTADKCLENFTRSPYIFNALADEYFLI